MPEELPELLPAPLDDPLDDVPPDELLLLLLEDELDEVAPLDDDVAPLEAPPPSSPPLLMTVPPEFEEQAIAARTIDETEKDRTTRVGVFMGAPFSIARAAEAEKLQSGGSRVALQVCFRGVHSR